MKILNCPKYNECLDLHAKTMRVFKCKGCSQFSKYHYLLTVMPIKNGDEKKEDKMPPKEIRKCIQCGKEFEPKRSDSKFCEDRSCRDAWYRDNLKKSKNGNGPKKKNIKTNRVPKAGPPATPVEAIYLPAEAIKAIKKSVALDIAQDFQKFITEKYA